MADPIRDAERLTLAGVRALDDAVLRVRGEDARSWLNGQLSNDVREMQPGAAVYALVLDGRGKILADTWVLERGEDVLLVVPPETVDALREHFEKYIVMEDVELEVAELAVVTVQGPRAGEVAGPSGYPCDRLGGGGRDLLVAPAERGAALARLGAAAEALGGGEVAEEGWELARLRASVPRFGADFGPAHYPQEAGLKERAVSFTKGCYLGQEVVCTLENRGQLSRRLVRLEGPVARPGSELRSGDRVVGEVTSALHDPARGAAVALGYVKRAAATIGARLEADGGELAVTALVGEAGSGHAEGAAL